MGVRLLGGSVLVALGLWARAGAQDTAGSRVLRPEITASVCRAFVQHGLDRQGISRLYYIGPAFRRERPQKGRLRQFHQAGCEVLGEAAPGTDVEVIAVGLDLLAAAGGEGSELLLGHPNEVPQLDHIGRQRMLGGPFVQGFMHRHDLLGGSTERDLRFMELFRGLSAAPFQTRLAPGFVDEDAGEGFRLEHSRSNPSGSQVAPKNTSFLPINHPAFGEKGGNKVLSPEWLVGAGKR